MLAEKQALAKVLEVLSEAVGEQSRNLGIERKVGDSLIDLVATLGSRRFAVELKRTAGEEQVVAAIEQLRKHAVSLGKSSILVLAVPYMGPVGRRICEEKGISWLDLSGNARIQAPGLRVVIEGRPNKFKPRGRPASVFAPKSSRIARWLIMNPGRSASQREIARQTRMDEGFTSRIVSRLESQGFLHRDAGGAVRVRNPWLLLDSWRERYDFNKNDIVEGHVPARSGEALLGTIAASLRERRAPYAATGLAGAWLLTGYAGFRIVTVYATEHPSPAIRESIGFREEPRGANVWWVVPKDEGALAGASDRNGIMCVHPVQVYLDLRAHPERAREAAERLRAELLTFEDDG